jgi:hypothetical protein
MGHADNNLAAALIATLASIPADVLIPAYNHDDVYVYAVDSLEIIDRVPVNSYRAADIKRGVERMPKGYAWASGIKASSLGLWHAPDSTGRIVCGDRARLNRLAFNAAAKACGVSA